MTPREKAEDLAKKYYYVDELRFEYISQAKKCALIAVDEIMKAGSDVDEYAECYWQEVKIEIERL